MRNETGIALISVLMVVVVFYTGYGLFQWDSG